LRPSATLCYNIAMKKQLHPLDIWLLEQQPIMSLPAFAAKKGLKVRALYEHVNGEVKDPKLLVMQAIEKATSGAVTVQMQANWFKSQAKK
jgi:hypothetical protein